MRPVFDSERAEAEKLGIAAFQSHARQVCKLLPAFITSGGLKEYAVGERRGSKWGRTVLGDKQAVGHICRGRLGGHVPNCQACAQLPSDRRLLNHQDTAAACPPPFAEIDPYCTNGKGKTHCPHQLQVRRGAVHPSDLICPQYVPM
jgi:hypothetical protein